MIPLSLLVALALPAFAADRDSIERLRALMALDFAGGVTVRGSYDAGGAIPAAELAALDPLLNRALAVQEVTQVPADLAAYEREAAAVARELGIQEAQRVADLYVYRLRRVSGGAGRQREIEALLANRRVGRGPRLPTSPFDVASRETDGGGGVVTSGLLERRRSAVLTADSRRREPVVAPVPVTVVIPEQPLSIGNWGSRAWAYVTGRPAVDPSRVRPGDQAAFTGTSDQSFSVIYRWLGDALLFPSRLLSPNPEPIVLRAAPARPAAGARRANIILGRSFSTKMDLERLDEGPGRTRTRTGSVTTPADDTETPLDPR